MNDTLALSRLRVAVTEGNVQNAVVWPTGWCEAGGATVVLGLPLNGVDIEWPLKAGSELT